MPGDASSFREGRPFSELVSGHAISKTFAEEKSSGTTIFPMPAKLPELYIAVDVEADGPIPGPYSMLSLGMAVAGHPDLSFYTELKPISDEYVERALAVSGLDREKLIAEAPTPEEAMANAAKWVNRLRKIGRPVFLAAPAVWDGMFVHWYFVKYTGNSPFGATGSGVDLRSFWMGLTGCEWVESRKGRIKHELELTGLPHTHHAGEDARELAAVFEAAMKRQGIRPIAGPSESTTDNKTQK